VQTLSELFVKVANSPRTLLLVFLAVLTSASAVYSVMERASLLDALYWSIVTATTLGYGDFSPHSTAGKVLTSVLICVMVFLFIPTITANLASKLIVDRNVFTDEEQEGIKDSLARIEARLGMIQPAS
jgi:voltage-gated potassium channel